MQLPKTKKGKNRVEVIICSLQGVKKNVACRVGRVGPLSTVSLQQAEVSRGYESVGTGCQKSLTNPAPRTVELSGDPEY